MKLGEIGQRRWYLFKKNGRGLWSLWIFLSLFVLSLFAELIANDKPFYIRYAGQHFFPAFVSYPETAFGGDFDTEPDYRDPWLIELIEADGRIYWPLIPYDYATVDWELTSPAPSKPDARHWLGTDDQARDVLARVIYGFRISILFGFALTIVSAIIGVFAGAVQGYYGGWVDLLLQRFMEIWGSMPTLYLLIILASMVTPNFWWLLLIMLLFSWMGFVGVVRAEFLKARKLEYVRAARALGENDWVIMYRHVLPNALVATITFMPFTLAGSVTILSGLDFLGFGLPAGEPSLGELVKQAKANLQAPWLGFTAFFVLSLMLSLMIFIGEAVRDAFDPRKLFG